MKQTKSLQITRRVDAALVNRFDKLVVKLRKVRHDEHIKPTDILREIVIVRLNAEGM